MTHARIVDGQVVELIHVPEGEDISDLLHPLLAAQCIPSDEGVEPGWLVDGTGFSPPSSVVDLDELKTRLKAQIDGDAENRRLRYITGGTGQALTYAQKAEEARLCLLASVPDMADFPLLSAEVGITAPTLVGVAGVVAEANAQWLVIGAAIEAARLAAKKSVAEAVSIDETLSAVAAINWP